MKKQETLALVLVVSNFFVTGHTSNIKTSIFLPSVDFQIFLRMAHSYVEGIKVKISEKYKPPFRISKSQQQYLMLNEKLQEELPGYDFGLEKTMVENINTMKEHRKSMVRILCLGFFSASNQIIKQVQKKHDILSFTILNKYYIVYVYHNLSQFYQLSIYIIVTSNSLGRL